MSGNSNTSLGSNALSQNSTGVNNTAIGGSALRSNKTGSNNVALGYESGSNCINYNGNTLIGAFTDTNSNSVANSTAIGYGAVADASNTIVLGGNLTGSYPVVSALGGVKTSSVNFNYPSNPVFPSSNSLGYFVVNNNVIDAPVPAILDVAYTGNVQLPSAGTWLVNIILNGIPQSQGGWINVYNPAFDASNCISGFPFTYISNNVELIGQVSTSGASPVNTYSTAGFSGVVFAPTACNMILSAGASYGGSATPGVVGFVICATITRIA